MKCIQLPAQEAWGIQPSSWVPPQRSGFTVGLLAGKEGASCEGSPATPGGTNPKCKHFTMLPSTATSPAGPTGCARGQGHPAGTAVPVQGLFAPNYSLTLLLASSQVWCSEHGTSPRATSQRFGSTKIPAAGKSSNLRQLSRSPHASRKAAVRWEAGKGMCCPCRSLGISPNAVGMRLCHGESPTRPATASQPSASTAGLAETSGKHGYG